MATDKAPRCVVLLEIQKITFFVWAWNVQNLVANATWFIHECRKVWLIIFKTIITTNTWNGYLEMNLQYTVFKVQYNFHIKCFLLSMFQSLIQFHWNPFESTEKLMYWYRKMVIMIHNDTFFHSFKTLCSSVLC